MLRYTTGCLAVALGLITSSGLALAQPQTLTLVKSEQKGSVLDRGIRDLKNTIAKTKAQAEALKTEAQEHLVSIAESIYSTYGQEKDPGRILLELKDLVDHAIEGMKAGRTGQVQEALGHAAQLVLDLASDKNPRIKAVNALQQVGWELAETKQTMNEQAEREARFKTDTDILNTLEKKNEALRKQQEQLKDDAAKNSVDGRTPKKPPTKPTTRKTQTDASSKGDSPNELAEVDDAIRLERWLDLGNRGFANAAEEGRFYKDFPELEKFRQIAETRSPATEALESINRARAMADDRKKALNQEEQRLKASQQTLKDSKAQLDQSLDLEREAQQAQRSPHIPEDILKASIPPGWIPCTCPDRHPHAGLLVNGQRWHTPALKCSMVF